MRRNALQLSWRLLGAAGVLALGLLCGDQLARHLVWPLVRPAVTGAGAQLEAPQERMLAEITLSDMSFYAVSMHNELDAQNAADYAQTIRALGGAGYVYAREGYHVLASAYERQADAQAVSDRLNAQGWDTQVVRATGGGVKFVVTGTPLEISMLDACAQFIGDAIRELGEWGDVSQAEEARAVAELAHNRLTQVTIHRARMLELMQAAPESGLVSGLLALLDNLERFYSGLSVFSAEQTLDISSEIRYNHIKLMLAYQEIARALMQ